MVVCSGCSCLCDDIEVDIEEDSIKEVRNACRTGADLFLEYKVNRAKCKVDGKDVSYDDALKNAIEVLKKSKNLFIFGFDSSTLEAQKKGVFLAEKINAFIDDTSSFYQGAVVEKILNSNIKTCTLDDVRHESDVTVYWGSDPSNSHPRHLSKFSYFPRGDHRQKGWEIDRNLVCIDVRNSSTMKISRKKFIIPPEGDEKFIECLIDAIDGKVPKSSEIKIEAKKLIDLANLLKKSRHGIIFSGLGLICALKNNLEPLESLMDKLNKESNFHLIPMLENYNTRGFNETLFNQTGYVNSVKFDSEKVKEHGASQSFIEALIEDKFDAALIVGSDPLSDVSFSISKKLSEIPIITLDSTNTPTTAVSKVVISSAKNGIEAQGKALRMDGVELSLEKLMDSEYLAEEEILDALIKGLNA